jgi:2-aminoadipate transaminase
MSTTENVPQSAGEENVAFVPGESFFANGGGQNTMRLNFSMMPPDRINEGLQG